MKFAVAEGCANQFDAFHSPLICSNKHHLVLVNSLMNTRVTHYGATSALVCVSPPERLAFESRSFVAFCPLSFHGTLVCLHVRASCASVHAFAENKFPNAVRVKQLLRVLFPAAGALYSPQPNYLIICIRELRQKPPDSFKSQRQMQQLQDVWRVTHWRKLAALLMLLLLLYFSRVTWARDKTTALHCRLQLVGTFSKTISSDCWKQWSRSVFSWLNVISLILFSSFIHTLQFQALQAAVESLQPRRSGSLYSYTHHECMSAWKVFILVKQTTCIISSEVTFVFVPHNVTLSKAKTRCEARMNRSEETSVGGGSLREEVRERQRQHSDTLPIPKARFHAAMRDTRAALFFLLFLHKGFVTQHGIFLIPCVG